MANSPVRAVAPGIPGARGVRIPEPAITLLRDLVEAQTGMHYDTPRLPYLLDRLSDRAVERGFDSLLDYYYLLKYDSAAEDEWARAIDALAVPETYFWRESDQFRALTQAIMPTLVRTLHRPVRIWSVPCASGEEPLSIAMALTEAGWYGRAEIELVASDASEAALGRAASGTYGKRSFRQIPPHLWERHFERLENSDRWRVNAQLRARVSSWTRVNVVRDEELDAYSDADVVFCRNLFIYFEPRTVQRIVNRIADRMPSPGFLCVGASESLLRLTDRFELCDLAGAYVYAKR